jgi:two-component system CheB/CheR fusion protein
MGATNNDYIIGIGASAGGLEAINELFDNIPGNTNFSYVVIQHLSPDYKSLMGELLSKHTAMQVYEAHEQMELRPNCVYLLPPGKTMTIKDNMCLLENKVKKQQPNNAIDIFFESLAQEKKDKAVGIILSGTGSDGTHGITAIKNNGGIVIVQDPITAEFDGMPNSAISTGYADLILSPDMIPDELLGYLKETPIIKSFNTLNHQEEAILLDILEQVQRVTTHDFSHYKRPTITRRLAKRMGEKGISSLADYYEILKTDPEEVKSLFKELLINVTKFFRDEEAFDVIKNVVIPALFNNKAGGETIKLWSVACSTGEEAYSMAILLQEYIEANKKYEVNVKIFATDIDPEAIEIASKGIYTDANVKDLSPELLQRFFTKEGSNYRVIPSLRKMVVFARHDVLKDPPFSKIDLLSCRNMLIYMNPLLQKIILQKFHFALNQDGYIFLGPSENLGGLKDVMKEIEKKWKIYQCTSKAKPSDHDSFLNPVHKSSYLDMPLIAKPKNALNNIADIFKDTLLEEYDFTGIYIDKEFEVKQAIGNFKKFINFPDGNFNFNLLKLVPPDLSIALSTCIRKAIKDDKKVVLKRVKVSDNKSSRYINIVVKPYIAQKNYLQPFLFVILNEEAPQREPVKNALSKEEHTSFRIEELESELRDTKENLQAVIEEVESANEELQSSNEEIISSNEELQSTNEELQSLNEELHTVNAEHQLKIKELLDLNDDMNNYFSNTEIGQILIDKKLIIKKFTPAVTRQVNLIASDLGRSITDISVNFRNLDFINYIKQVVKTGTVLQQEITMDDGNAYFMRIAPYIKQDKTKDGVVVNFINITELKRLNSLIDGIFNSTMNGIAAMKAIRNKRAEITDFEIIAGNNAVHKIFDTVSENMVGKSMKQELAAFTALNFDKFTSVVNTGNELRFDYFDNQKRTWLEVGIVKMMDGVVATFTDITESKKSFSQLQDTTDMLRTSNQQLEQSNYDLLQFASVASHDLKEPLRKIQTFGNKLQEKVQDNLPEKEMVYLQKIIKASNRMQTLIEDILMLSKLSNVTAERAKVNVNDILNNIVDDLEIVINEKKTKLNIGKLPEIYAVPGQIHQLFQNLISNAIKFNEQDPPVITIAEEKISDDLADRLKIDRSKYICITVQDNGIGFDQEYSDKIFGVFQRLNGSNYQGTGIGLAICKKIIDNHQGYIFADSRANEGAKFTIVLPR